MNHLIILTFCLTKQPLSTAVLSNRIAVDSWGKRWELGWLSCSRWAQVGRFSSDDVTQIRDEFERDHATINGATATIDRRMFAKWLYDGAIAGSGWLLLRSRQCDRLYHGWCVDRFCDVWWFSRGEREVAGKIVGRWEGWTAEKGVSPWCHESSWIFYGSSKARDICAEHLSAKTDNPLFQNSWIKKNDYGIYLYVSKT